MGLAGSPRGFRRCSRARNFRRAFSSTIAWYFSWFHPASAAAPPCVAPPPGFRFGLRRWTFSCWASCSTSSRWESRPRSASRAFSSEAPVGSARAVKMSSSCRSRSPSAPSHGPTVPIATEPRQQVAREVTRDERLTCLALVQTQEKLLPLSARHVIPVEEDGPEPPEAKALPPKEAPAKDSARTLLQVARG